MLCIKLLFNLNGPVLFLLIGPRLLLKGRVKYVIQYNLT